MKLAIEDYRRAAVNRAAPPFFAKYAQNKGTMARHRKRLPSLPPSMTDAEVAEYKRMLSHLGDKPAPAPRQQRLKSEQHQLTLDEQLELVGRREDAVEPLVNDDALNTILTSEPNARERVAANAERAGVRRQLAEAQVGLVARCAVCGKPVTGRDVPRDSRGRPRHHRCPL